LIADDEPLLREALARQLAQAWPELEVVAQVRNGREAIKQFEARRPDICFLDVHMPGLSGVETAHHIGRRAHLVFVTAYDQYAVRAFEENAVDYLLKPFRTERLAAALARARRELAQPAELSRRLEELLASVGPAGRAGAWLDRFTVRLGVKQLIVRAEDVLWFGAEDKLVFAATGGAKHYVNFTLDELERRLDPARFVRVHRGAIANLDRAAALRPGFAGTWRLQLNDEARTEVPVSRARARQLKARLGA